MSLSNFENHLKASTFKNFKRLLYKYHSKLVKTYENQSNSSSNRLDRNQCLVLLYDSVPNLKHFLSIGNLLNNSNILQVRTGKNPITALYKETTKPNFFY